MKSWFSSWLPGLPSLNFALPASLQSKFISFVLKKTLGHFLKPGQLDSRQIDSQIGSGFVQINQLELDNETINALLSDLPITLNDGYISSAIARIPWPNPLTSTLGFSLESLHLTFHLQSSPVKPSQGDTNLADSMVSAAESFIYDELNSNEARLWDSCHIDAAQSNDDVNVPGGLDLDPFLYNPEDILSPDTDPAGVSIFATLIERLLARFEFDAVNTMVTLVHPGNMSITASISDIRYRTEVVDDASSSPSSSQRRVATITGITLTTHNLRPTAPNSYSAESVFPVSPTNSVLSSSSDLDEETQFAMSQSLVALPPRLTSSTSSIESSMYQSAISTSPVLSYARLDSGQSDGKTPSPISRTALHEDVITGTCDKDTLEEDIEECTMLSFGSSPIVLELTNHRPALVSQEIPPPSSVTAPKENGDDNFHFSITIGLIAVAFSAWHVRGILEMLHVWSRHSFPSSGPKPVGVPPVDIGLTLSLRARGVVLLIIMPFSSVSQSNLSTALSEYFERPLVPPVLPSGYYRFFIDGISGHISSDPTYNDFGRTGKQKPMKTDTSSHTNLIPIGLSFTDISLFAVYESSRTSAVFASPVLLTDRDLSTQYASAHLHPRHSDHCPLLPTLKVVDWTDEKYHSHGFKLSLWRTKVKRGQDQAQGIGARSSQRLSSMTDSAAAVTITVRRRKVSHSPHQKPPGNEVELQIISIHILLDLGKAFMVDRVNAFLDEALDNCAGRGAMHHATGARDESNYPDSDGETPPASPQAGVRQTEKQRHKLETLAPNNLLLGFNYGQNLSSEENSAKKARTQRQRASEDTVTISANIDMIRLQIRCPTPPGRPTRSGALIFDLHSINITTTPSPRRHTARFADNHLPLAAEQRASHQDLIAGSDIRRIVVACSPVGGSLATSILSSGPIETESGRDLTFGSDLVLVSPLQPRFSVTKSRVASDGSSSVMAFSVELPSVHVDISKGTIDTLQYWIDDLSQLIERISKDVGPQAGEDVDSDIDLIGSRFFAKSRSGSALSSGTEVTRYETVVKVAISESFLRAMVPHAKGEIVYPFILSAADVDVLFEMKPEGKDESVLTIGVMDLALYKIQAPLENQTLISLTSPRSLSSSPKSMVKLRFTSLVVPETTAKESKVKLTLWGFTFNSLPDVVWISDLAAFSKSPPGTFESVIPSERTSIQLKIHDGSVRALARDHPGAIVVHVGDLKFSTDIVGNSTESFFKLLVPALAILVVDDLSSVGTNTEKTNSNYGVAFWKDAGFVLLSEVADLSLNFKQTPSTHAIIEIDHVALHVHLCADSLTAVAAIATDLGSLFPQTEEDRAELSRRRPAVVSPAQYTSSLGLMASVDDLAFKKLPEVGPAPDMINDDLPTNMDYLDESFGAAAGLRELSDDDLDEFDVDEMPAGTSTDIAPDGTGIISRVGGETVKMFRPEGIRVLDNYFQTLPADAGVQGHDFGEATLHLRVYSGDVTVLLYDGYDWLKTRKAIENEVKEIRRRLTRIRQLVATGQVPDSSAEETSTLLFNSVHIGLDRDVDGLEPGALLAAIDEELKDDAETASQSSWQSLQPPIHGKVRGASTRAQGRRLTRSKGSSMEFRLMGLRAEVDHYRPDEPMVSRTLVTVRDLEILDHIKTSTWKKFLTELRSDSRGNIRETDSNMVRVELRHVHPVPGHPSQEARLRAKILPLRLYVDQDAVDFLKRFFSFKDPNTPPPDSSSEEIYFQSAEIFPIDLKLDYKPRRVDYRALREGRTIELMNFFHFDGAEMTLRHITLAGITGWPRLFELLNDLWTPDVKATQLVEVISGVAPIRSVVNVGSGVADLVLLPIAQYKKDGRIVRGVQKGTTAFVRSTATEAIKLGARLATGTQVILEQAEGVLGGQFQHPITAETVQGTSRDGFVSGSDDDDDDDDDNDDDDDESVDISKYAQQPGDLKEGIQSAYKSLRKNLNAAAQTILAVPMEVYERSENEGPVRAVIRAVPIAVLKPMIGASEAVSKTLLGLHNSLDPDIRHDNEAKYKRR